jgi:glycosyl transferase family 25
MAFVQLINLESARVRRERMTARLARQGVAVDTVGVDLREIARDDARALAAERFPSLRFDFRILSPAEVGCWLSHLTAWRRGLERPAAGIAVVEDDVTLAPGFRDAVSTLSASTGSFDLVMLGTWSRNLSARRRERVGGLWVHVPVGVVLGTWGYVVSRAWVERLFAGPPMRIGWPIDQHLGGRARTLRPRVGVLQPCVVDEDLELAIDSQIGPYTRRLDRLAVLDKLRRAAMGSRVADLYYGTVYRWL